jgi:hypothetical protein
MHMVVQASFYKLSCSDELTFCDSHSDLLFIYLTIGLLSQAVYLLHNVVLLSKSIFP